MYMQDLQKYPKYCHFGICIGFGIWNMELWALKKRFSITHGFKTSIVFNLMHFKSQRNIFLETCWKSILTYDTLCKEMLWFRVWGPFELKPAKMMTCWWFYMEIIMVLTWNSWKSPMLFSWFHMNSCSGNPRHVNDIVICLYDLFMFFMN